MVKSQSSEWVGQLIWRSIIFVLESHEMIPKTAKFSLAALSFAVALTASGGFASTLTVQNRVFQEEVIQGFNLRLENTIAQGTQDYHRSKLATSLSNLVALIPGFESYFRQFPVWVREDALFRQDGVTPASGKFYGSGDWYGVSVLTPNTGGRSDAGYFVLILHEFAHARHLLGVLQRQEDRVSSAYENAIRKGLYLNLAIQGGGIEEQGYARQNEKEYFAVLSEAYYNTSRVYPHTRNELATYDPVGYAILDAVWKTSPGSIYQPDLLRKRKLFGDDFYEPKQVRKQEILLRKNEENLFTGTMRLQSDGARDLIRLHVRGFPRRMIKRFEMYDADIIKRNRTAEMRRGIVAAELGLGQYRGFGLHTKTIRSSKKSLRSLTVRATSTSNSSRRDTFRVSKK